MFLAGLDILAAPSGLANLAERESDLSWPAEILCQSININPSDKPETNQTKTTIADGIGIGFGLGIGCGCGCGIGDSNRNPKSHLPRNFKASRLQTPNRIRCQVSARRQRLVRGSHTEKNKMVKLE